MEETKQVARFAVETSYEDLPTEVVERTKDFVLDQLGCQVAFASLPWSKAVYRFVSRLGGRPESTIVYYGLKASPDNAAFANGSFGHAFEADDTHYQVTTHPGVVIIPAALAVGEQQAATGKDFLAATILGYEVMLRLAASVFPYCLARGHHTPPAVGPFGAAVAAGRLVGLDYEEMLNALGIAGSHAAGLLEYTQTGGEVKRVHAGIPASAGIRSALLAQEGLTGPPTVLEGKWGFCRVFVDTPDIEAITKDLGQEWLTLTTGLKPFTACGAIHGPIEIVLDLMRNHSVTADAIEHIRIGANSQLIHHVGTIYEPENILGAQFSMAFSLAVTLLKGGVGLKEYREDDLKDPRFLELAHRVKTEFDEETDQEYRQNGNPDSVKMTVTLKDGKSFYREQRYPKGRPQNPMTRADVQDKFRGLAGTALSRERVERIIAMVEGLEEMRSVSALASLLVA